MAPLFFRDRPQNGQRWPKAARDPEQDAALPRSFWSPRRAEPCDPRPIEPPHARFEAPAKAQDKIQKATMNTQTISTQVLPAIYVTEADFEILSNLADAAAGRVEFHDLSNGQTRAVRISLPRDASIDDNRISVLCPVGAALIGLTAGEAFHWTDPEGRARGVRVLAVQD
jgi:regulator of nucleoside diphosphate kinase